MILSCHFRSGNSCSLALHEFFPLSLETEARMRGHLSRFPEEVQAYLLKVFLCSEGQVRQ